MKKRNAVVPTYLQNGITLPRKFTDVLAVVPSAPKYKIAVYSIDSFASYYRLVHVYYVSVHSEDPSRLQALMRSRARPSTSGFEDGRHIDDMLLYKEHLWLKDMPAFADLLSQTVHDNAHAYSMVRFHNIVQLSTDHLGNQLVMSSIEVR